MESKNHIQVGKRSSDLEERARCHRPHRKTRKCRDDGSAVAATPTSWSFHWWRSFTLVVLVSQFSALDRMHLYLKLHTFDADSRLPRQPLTNKATTMRRSLRASTFLTQETMAAFTAPNVSIVAAHFLRPGSAAPALKPDRQSDRQCL